MWGNSMFGMEESRSSFNTPSTVFPSHNYKYSYVSPNNWSRWAPTYHPTGNNLCAFPENRQPPPPPPAAATAAHRVVAYNSSASWRAYFQATKANNKLIVVEFTAAWCGPCRKMEPVIDGFAAKYRNVEFAKIDVDKLLDVSCEYGVQTMPTFLLMKNGKVVDKVTGTRNEELQRKIEFYSS